VGKLDCSKDGDCPDTGSFYEFENKKMCGEEEPVGPIGPIGPIDEDDDRVCSASVRVCVCFVSYYDSVHKQSASPRHEIMLYALHGVAVLDRDKGWLVQ
jgi:hypothetical protein